MAITGLHLAGFGSQGLECFDLAVNISNGAAISPWSPKETRVWQGAGGLNLDPRSGQTESLTAITTEWVTIGCYFYHTNISDNGLQDVDIIRAKAGGTDIAVRVTDNVTGGTNDTLTLVDANGAEIEDLGGVLVADFWHRIILKYKRSNTSDVRVWLNGELIIDRNNFDADSGAGVQRVAFHMQPNLDPSPGPPLYDTVGGGNYVLMDDGANIDTNVTVFGRYVVRKPYQSTDSGNASDVGDSLGGGTTWSSSSELPVNDAAFSRYALSVINPADSGLVTCDGGARPGPDGDPDATTFDERVMMAVWNWRAKRNAGKHSVAFSGLYGVVNSATPTVDGTAAQAFGNLGATAKWYRKVIGLQHAKLPIPSSDHAFQYGMSVTRGTGTPFADLLECTIYQLQLEDRIVNMDGQVIRSL